MLYIHASQRIESAAEQSARRPLAFLELLTNRFRAQSTGKTQPEYGLVLFRQGCKTFAQEPVIIVAQRSLLRRMLVGGNKLLDGHLIERDGWMTNALAVIIHQLLPGNMEKPGPLFLFGQRERCLLFDGAQEDF